VKTILEYMDKRQNNHWFSIGVGVSCLGAAALPQLHGYTAIVVGCLISVIGGNRGK
jgi:hypothetical protein